MHRSIPVLATFITLVWSVRPRHGDQALMPEPGQTVTMKGDFVVYRVPPEMLSGDSWGTCKLSQGQSVQVTEKREMAFNPNIVALTIQYPKAQEEKQSFIIRDGKGEMIKVDGQHHDDDWWKTFACKSEALLKLLGLKPLPSSFEVEAKLRFGVDTNGWWDAGGIKERFRIDKLDSSGTWVAATVVKMTCSSHITGEAEVYLKYMGVETEEIFVCKDGAAGGCEIQPGKIAQAAEELFG